jgi:protein-disulfide isomerase
MKKMLVSVLAMAALSACSGAGGDKEAAGNNATSVVAPAGTDWVSTVVKTPEGGYQMGNPAAAIKLVEYGAFSCSHCGKFSKDSSEGLKAFVAKGSVSYEFRSFLINPQDVAASLLAACNGPAPYHAIAEGLFADQGNWNGANIANLTPADQQALSGMAPNQMTQVIGEKLGLIAFVGARGIGPDKAKACLADQAAIDALGAITTNGQKQFEITGTPTFIINGNVVRDANTWDALEPKLKAAGA